MTELLTAAQMREIERAAIDSGSVTGLHLMERAGRGVVDAVFVEWPELATGTHRAVVLCGPGNNGGDGFVVARRLRDKGWQVEVLFWGAAEKLPPDARKNHDVWRAMGEIAPLTPERAAAGLRPVLLVDAMFGTGLGRAIPLDLAKAFHAVQARDVGEAHPWLVPYHRVAVDCPSGLDCDSGQFLLPQMPDGLDGPDGVDEAAVDRHWSWWRDDAALRLLHVDLTVSFHREKVGHVLNGHLGKVRIVDIGLGKEDRHPAHLRQPRPVDRVIALKSDRRGKTSDRIWPAMAIDKGRGPGRHKYDHGHALILSGGVGRGGAARMAARGALRIGAGLVTVGCPPSALIENAAQLDAIMLRRVADADALSEMLKDKRLNALCLGPGLGTGAREAALVGAAVRAEHRPSVVLDADALSLMAQDADLFAALHDRCVLTPHDGEFARLFPDIAKRLKDVPTCGPAYSRVDAARAAAARAGCVVLCKGAETVIADPEGRCSINAASGARAAPWLATAGSGDVLAGFITGLLARGIEPMQAAELAAWLHVECARSFGPGLIAEDLPEELPKVFRQIGI